MMQYIKTSVALFDNTQTRCDETWFHPDGSAEYRPIVGPFYNHSIAIDIEHMDMDIDYEKEQNYNKFDSLGVGALWVLPKDE